MPEVDAATRTRTLVLKLTPTSANNVSPGEIAHLAVTTTTATDGYWLPVSALVKQENNFKVDRRYVEVLATQADEVLVRGTLRSGDSIIADGTHRLVSGQLVRIFNEQ